MNPLHLTLTGFRGIRAGQGADTFGLDLTKLDGDLIALIGQNGSGKTTVLDNLQPYRLMPSKVADAGSYSPGAFSYWDHVAPRARKVLLWSHNGSRYRSTLEWETVRGQKNQSAVLEVANGSGWVGAEGSDGKVTTYDAAVEAVLGPPQLFFTSAFAAQGRRPLAAYKASDIKGLLSSMLGLDYLEEMGRRAGQLRKRIGARLTDRLRGVADVGALKEEMARLKLQKEDAQNDLIAHELRISQIERSIERQTKQRAGIDEDGVKKLLAAEKTARDQAQETHEHFSRLIADAESRLKAVSRRAGGLEEILKQRPAIEDAGAQADALERALREYDGLQDAIQAQRKALEDLRARRAGMDTKPLVEAHTRTSAQLSEASSSAGLIDDVPCSGMEPLQRTCPLLSKARGARNALSSLQITKQRAEEDLRLVEADVELIEGQIGVLHRDIASDNAWSGISARPACSRPRQTSLRAQRRILKPRGRSWKTSQASSKL